jgi:hypothetical protein
LFIQDYGIVTTTVALMTLTGIGCLLGILLRNALPRAMCRRRTQEFQDRKSKKKRKGLGRLKSPRKQDVHGNCSQDNDTSILTHPCSLSEDSQNVEESEEKLSNADTPKLEVLTPQSPTKSTFRQRMPSSSTIDTTLDDASCDSFSVRSFSSTPTAVTVGSTGNSESGRSLKRHTKKTIKSARLNHGPNDSHLLQERPNDIQEPQQIEDKTLEPQNRQNISMSIIQDQTPTAKLTKENLNQLSPTPVAANCLKQSHGGAPSTGSGDKKLCQTRTSDSTVSPVNHHTGNKMTSGLSRHASEVTHKLHDRKQQLPLPAGRFTNSKDRDTRFSNTRKNHGRIVQGKGKGRMVTSHLNKTTASPIHSDSSENTAKIKCSPKDFEQLPSLEPSLKMADENKFMKTDTPSLKGEWSQNFASSVQFGSPCNLEESTTPKKLELGSILASVGIVGRCESKKSLDTNFSEVDDLERFSFQLQTSVPQTHNNLERVWEQYHPTNWNHNCVLTPPPGLSSIHDEPPTLFGTPKHLNMATPNIVTTADRFTPTAWYPLANPFIVDEEPQSDCIWVDEESRIEAELQELGGQMIGSVLDF